MTNKISVLNFNNYGENMLRLKMEGGHFLLVFFNQISVYLLYIMTFIKDIQLSLIHLSYFGFY